MTGILFMAGSIARTIGPLVVSFLFDHYGPEVTWSIQMIFLGITIPIWILLYGKIVPLDVIQSSKSGDCKQENERISIRTKSTSTETVSSTEKF